MIGRRFISFLKRSPSSQPSRLWIAVQQRSWWRGRNGKPKGWGEELCPVRSSVGVALSALDDLAIYHGCSSAAMEKATANKAVIDAIGESIVRGPWYNVSLAVTHKRQSLSCTFPISGPKGTGIFQLRAVGGTDES